MICQGSRRAIRLDNLGFLHIDSKISIAHARSTTISPSGALAVGAKTKYQGIEAATSNRSEFQT